jgi:hypothetical protein
MRERTKRRERRDKRGDKEKKDIAYRVSVAVHYFI